MLDELHLPTPTGTVALRPASRTAERLIESYQALLHRWLTTGDSRALLAFRGQTVADAGAMVFDWDIGD